MKHYKTKAELVRTSIAVMSLAIQVLIALHLFGVL
jgi:hypothetical protein